MGMTSGSGNGVYHGIPQNCNCTIGKQIDVKQCKKMISQ